jgi:hypothetical protein
LVRSKSDTINSDVRGPDNGVGQQLARVALSIINQAVKLDVNTFSKGIAFTNAAFQQCAGLLGRFGSHAPLLKPRDLHGRVERLRFVLSRDKQHSANSNANRFGANDIPRMRREQTGNGL